MVRRISWNEYFSDETREWLLTSNAWTKERVYVDLLGKSLKKHTEVQEAHHELLASTHIKQLMKDALDWFPQGITRHNNAKSSHYKLMVLAELGLAITDLEMEDLVEKVIAHEEHGQFAILQQLPERGKKTFDLSVDEWHTMPCDSPILSYSLLKIGYKDSRIKTAINALKKEWNAPIGRWCDFHFVSSHHKKYQIGCPMAGLMALEVFSQLPQTRESKVSQNAFKPLELHRDLGKSLYFFGRGKKFWTLKYPFVWYNALYLADVLTRFRFLRGHPLLEELVDWIRNTRDSDGKWTATSMFRAWSTWDFADKKQPSPWITLLCLRALMQYSS